MQRGDLRDDLRGDLNEITNPFIVTMIHKLLLCSLIMPHHLCDSLVPVFYEAMP